MLRWTERFRKKFQFNYIHMFLYLVFGNTFLKSKADFKDFSQKEVDFYDFKLAPIIDSFEQKRKQVLLWFRIKFFVWLFLLVIVANYSVLPLALFLGFITFPVVTWSLKSYKHELKDKLIPEILGYFEGKYFYESRANSMDFNSLYSYGIMPEFNKLKAEDFICGKNGDTIFQLSELTLSLVTLERSYKRNAPDRERESVNFHGLCIVITFNKKFKHRLIAVPRGEYIGNSGVLRGVSFTRVKLEDPRFEKVFDLYGTDQIEARYIFTPTFMERLVKLRDELQASQLSCSFYDNTIQILISTDYDHFKIRSIFLEIDFILEFRMILREMEHVNKIVKTLKLNKRF